jgi:spore coat polysaccharide biosynthesis protein SpsF
VKNIAAIIQARMSSSRLPNKVLLPIGNKSMLEWVFSRTQRADKLTKVVVATTIDLSDEPVVSFCKEKGYPVYRGSVNDVLDRYYQTARKLRADVVVRITGDCPFIDPDLINDGIRLLTEGSGPLFHDIENQLSGYDFIANRLPPPWGRTYPIGLDLEVFTFDFLEEAWRLAKSQHQREHVTPFFYDDVPADKLRYHGPGANLSTAIKPDGRAIALMHHTPNYGNLRWTVDTVEDLVFAQNMVSHFKDDTFTWKEILKLVMEEPDLIQINAHVKHKTHLDVDDRI